LNLHTGAITSQFHVVFDDLFSTIPYIGGESGNVEGNLPNHWEQLCLENSTSIPFDNSSKLLQDDWLNAEEMELKYRAQQRELQHKQFNCHNHHKLNSKQQLNQNNNRSKLWRVQTAQREQMSETQRE